MACKNVENAEEKPAMRQRGIQRRRDADHRRDGSTDRMDAALSQKIDAEIDVETKPCEPAKGSRHTAINVTFPTENQTGGCMESLLSDCQTQDFKTKKQSNMSEKTQHKNILITIAGATAVLAAVAIIGSLSLKQEPEIIEGQVEVSEYRVSSKVPGRILELRVKEGDYVNAGDTLAIIDAPK